MIELLNKYAEEINKRFNISILENIILQEPLLKEAESDIERHKNMYHLLKMSCKSNIFDLLESFFIYIIIENNNNGVNVYNLTESSFIIIEENNIVVKLSHFELPYYKKQSVDFIYLHETTHGLMAKYRIGKKLNLSHSEVLPFFMELYTLNILDTYYSQETKNTVISLIFLELLNKLNIVLNYLNKEESIVSANEYYDNLIEYKMIIKDYASLIGIIKAIALFTLYKKRKIRKNKIFKAIINNKVL